MKNTAKQHGACRKILLCFAGAALSALLSGCPGGSGGGVSGDGSGGGINLTPPISASVPIQAPCDRGPVFGNERPENGEVLPMDMDCYEFGYDYGLTNIKAAAAYRHGYLGQGVTVAVIDSGMLVTHRDFTRMVQVNGRRIPISNIAPGGYDIVNLTNDVTDSVTGHGTNVGGIIAAVANERGRQGVAPRAKLLPLQAGQPEGGIGGIVVSVDVNSATETTITVLHEAYRRAVRAGVQVANNSYGESAYPVRGAYTHTAISTEEQTETITATTVVGEVITFEITNTITITSTSTLTGSSAIPFGVLPFFNTISARDRAQDILAILTTTNSSGPADMVMVWATGNDSWNPDGMINLADDEGNPVTVVNRSEFINGFVSEDILDEDGNVAVINGVTLLGLGTLSAVANISNSFASTRSRLPYFAASRAAYAQYVAEVAVATSAVEAGDAYTNLLNDDGHRAMVDRWLAVGAVDSSNNIADFSNGCGDTMWWCLVAPGADIRTTNNDGGYTLPLPSAGAIDGTSFSAPHASGALAVIKSAMPTMPMSMVKMILLDTATDLGDKGVDEVYGFGLINLESAVAMVRGASINSSTTSAGVRLHNARIDLPSHMAHLKPRLAAVQTAVGGLGGLYYNMPLSDIAHIAAAPAFNFGGAAKDMLSPVHDSRFDAGVFFAATDPKTEQFRYVGAELSGGALGDWRLRHDFCDDCKDSAWKEWNAWNQTDAVASAPMFAKEGDSVVLQMQGEGLRPFAAFGGAKKSPWQQLGFRWQKSYSRIGVLAEASHVDEKESFMGVNFGALGQGGAQTKQGRFVLHGDIASGWRGFAEYRHARGAGTGEDGGFLSAVSALRSESWSAGMEWADIFSFGDKIRISARRDFSLTGGRAEFRHMVAEGDTTRAFYSRVLNSPESSRTVQTVHESETGLNLAGGKPPMILSLGYAAQMRNGGEIAFGAEYAGGESALSAQYRLEF